MSVNWIPLREDRQIGELVAESQTTPVVIFKHSTRCNISAAALARLERNWKSEEMTTVKPYLLDLLSFRQLSSRIAEDFGIQHESPQLLLIQQGKPVYHESHMSISYQKLKDLLKN